MAYHSWNTNNLVGWPVFSGVPSKSSPLGSNCPTLDLHIYLFTYLPIYLSTNIYVYLSIYLPIYLYLPLSTYLSIHPSIHLSIYLSIHPSIYLLNAHSYISVSCHLKVQPHHASRSICMDFFPSSVDPGHRVPMARRRNSPLVWYPSMVSSGASKRIASMGWFKVQTNPIREGSVTSKLGYNSCSEKNEL